MTQTSGTCKRSQPKTLNWTFAAKIEKRRSVAIVITATLPSSFPTITPSID
jgi:hypothetical protein